MSQTDYRQRDAASYLMLGAFFAVMGTLVLIGTFWTLERMHAMVVNLVAGLILLAAGVAMLALGVRVRRGVAHVDAASPPGSDRAANDRQP
ncbi:MAG: hypothetical protein AB7U73_18820 [Pirellulales bacterium]